MTKLTNPVPLFLDLRGALLDAGYVYVGAAGQDPEATPIATFFDAERTIPAAQPLRTMGGRIVNGAYPATVYFAANDFSMRTRDADGNQIDYSPSLTSASTQYQPLDTDLSAIAALSTTAFGRSLLQLANQSALKQATGIPDPLPLTGGQVTGNITRQNAGVHQYWANPAITGGRIYMTADSASDPSSQSGDWWLKYHVS
jgi:hypothetical protein